MPENADRFVLNVPLKVLTQAFGGGAAYYPSDDDNDIVHGPGGPRARLRDLIRAVLSQQAVRAGNGSGSNPNPDEDDDFGPGWPVVRVILEAVRSRRLSLEQATTFLARFGPEPEPWLTAGPEPQPWRAALLARVSIDRFVGLAEAAELGGSGQAQQAVSRKVAQLTEELCGTKLRPRPPLPWPFRLRRPDEEFDISPAEQLAMGVEFYRASEALGDAPLASDFAEAAHKLAQTGFDRLAE